MNANEVAPTLEYENRHWVLDSTHKQKHKAKRRARHLQKLLNDAMVTKAGDWFAVYVAR